MINFLLSIVIFIIGVALGLYLLLLGRRALWATTAIICLAFTGGLLALIVLGESSSWEIVEQQAWILLAIALAAGVTGGIIGSRARPVASAIIGFAAGGYLALWLYDIAFYLIQTLGDWPNQTAFWVGVALLFIGGVVGLYFTRRDPGIAIIIISVFVGTDIIISALGLSSQSSLTAIVALSLALVGLVVQYAQYLREIKKDRPLFANEMADRPAPELFDLSDQN